MFRRTSILGVIWSITVVGCGDGEHRTEMNVLRAKVPEPGQSSAELQRKRAMQAITVRSEASHSFFEIDSIVPTLKRECFAAAFGQDADPNCGPPEGAPTGCVESRQASFCMASALMDLARGNEAVFQYLWPAGGACGETTPPINYGSGPFRVMPLTPAQKIEVIIEARQTYVSLIRDLSIDIGYNRCRDENGDQMVAASAIVEAFHGYEEVTNLAVEADLAVAESEMASTPDTSIAVQRAMSSPLYSHASAASWLVGGAAPEDSDRLITFPGAGDGFCTVPRLSAQAELALNALREAAPAPAAILAIPKNSLVPSAGEISIDDLLNQRGLATGSILERLEHVWNTTITDSDIAVRLGVDKKAFVEARAYLAQEITAFARPLTQCTGPANPAQFRRYTATANPPAARSSAYFAAIARSAPYERPGWSWYNDRPFDTYYCRTNMDWLTIYGQRGYGLDRFREDMLSYVNCMESWAGPASVAPLVAIRSALNRVKQETITHDFHRAEGSWNSWDYSNINIPSGALGSRGYRVVHGEDALECLTLGSVDGVDCSANAAEGQPGGSWNVCDLSASHSCVVYPPLASGTWYLLRSLGNANWLEAAGGAAARWDTPPRQWEPVTGFIPIDPVTPGTITGSPETTPQRTIPVYSDIESRLKTILQPGKSWCTKTEQNCLGLREDDPIPLENELATDGSSSENSWKYYLDMAADAAAKSDELAQQYYDASLSVDQLQVDEERYRLNKQQQAVARLEELQKICGTGVAASDLLNAIQGLSDSVLTDRFDMKNLFSGPCNGSEGAATSVYDCDHDFRVVNFQKLIALHPDLTALKSCVDDLTSTSTNVDLVHLGDVDLCVPDLAIDNACGTKENPCPDNKVAQSSEPKCPSETKNNTTITYTLVPKEDGLAFFHTLADGTISEGASVCSDLRRQRTTRTGPLPDTLTKAATLNAQNLHGVAQSLQFEAQAGGYVTIRGPGGTLYTTGSTITGPDTSGILCKQPPSVAGCSGYQWSGNPKNALLCMGVDCTNTTQRAALNQRLLEAFIAAKLSTAVVGDSSFQVMVPTYMLFNTAPDKVTTTETLQFYVSSTLSRALTKESSTHWQMFKDASGALKDSAMWLGTVGMYAGNNTQVPWNLLYQGTTYGYEPMHFAFQIRDITPKLDIAREFFAGLGGGTTAAGGTDGCLAQALLGTSPTDVDRCRADFQINFSFTNETSGKTSLTSNFSSAAGMQLPPFSDCSGGDWGNGQCMRNPNPTSSTQSSEALANKWNAANAGNAFPMALSIAIDWNSANESTFETYLDGAEMLCDAAGQADGIIDCGAPPPELRGVDQLGQTGAYLECLGRRISAKGATAVFKGIPKAVLDPLRMSTGTVYSSATGEIGQQLEELKVALLDTYKTEQVIGHVIRQFGQEMKALQATMRAFVDDAKIADVQFESTKAAETASCIAGLSSLVGTNTLFNPGAISAAAINCSNSMAQIKFADQMRDLQKQGVGAQTETAISRFNQSFDEKAQILDGQSTALSEALYRVNQAIGKVSDLRSTASRLLTETTWLLSNDAKSTANVRSATDSRRAIYATRYKSALEHSKRLAFLAKRAIEQRLGLHLDSMMENLPLVEAPARWESSLCFGAYPGLNYKWLSSPNNTLTNDAQAAEGTVVGGFIGDYVTKLGNVVESYRLVNGFQEGTDTAVVSLRDDILNVRQACKLPSRNLLINTADLTPKQYGPMAAGKGWFITGCNETLSGNVTGQSPPNCISLTKESSTTRPGGAEVDVPIYRMSFGGGTTASDPCNGVATGECGFLPNSMLAQKLHLPEGTYALTWYQQRTSATDESVIEAVISNEAALQVLRPSQVLVLGAPWNKKIAVFSLSSESDVTIGFRKGETNAEGNPGKNPAIWTAPMLERITSDQYATVPFADISVGKYELTDASGLATRTACEDRGGEAFRARWNTGCMKLCPDGYSQDCAGYAKEACYRDIAFPMSQWGLESNQQFVQSGFARGNFNYRINRVGLNFVGTRLRSCASSSLPASCNSGGFVNYSLEHQGPFAVRNHKGQDFIASLFEGRIEHARGVAAERYLTNPVSNTDKSLLEDYMRHEMSGRPLSGNFVLQVWDDPNLDFNALEDVQLVLEYGYWTRLSK